MLLALSYSKWAANDFSHPHHPNPNLGNYDPNQPLRRYSVHQVLPASLASNNFPIPSLPHFHRLCSPSPLPKTFFFRVLQLPQISSHSSQSFVQLSGLKRDLIFVSPPQSPVSGTKQTFNICWMMKECITLMLREATGRTVRGRNGNDRKWEGREKATSKEDKIEAETRVHSCPPAAESHPSPNP